LKSEFTLSSDYAGLDFLDGHQEDRRGQMQNAFALIKIIAIRQQSLSSFAVFCVQIVA
jgi:hypothetical protein